MTLMNLLGATFIAFGPMFAMFIFTIAREPVKIILMIAGAFFWLLSLLLSSILWYAVTPLRDQLAFALVFSVIFQEALRLAYYKILRKADEGMQRFADSGDAFISKKQTGYVAGLGFGVMSGSMMFINILADNSGPGTVGIRGDPEMFLLTSALLTLCFTLLHTFWGVILFDGMDKKKYLMVATVVASHMVASCLTLLNQTNPPLYLASIIPCYIILTLMIVWSFFVAGGSLQNLKAFLTCKHGGYNVD